MKPHKTELIKDTDMVKCWSILGNLQPSEIMELSRIPEERREVFIQCTKQYIDCFKNLTFNNDLTKIRKDERF
jgi:hypothetical protein